MTLKVGIVGLLIVLVVVLAMTQPRSFLSREGYTSRPVNMEDRNSDPGPLTIIAIILVMAIFGPMTLMLFR